MKKTIIIALVAITSVLASCSKDILNPQPQNSVTDDVLFTSVETAQTAINAAYSYVGGYLSFTLGTVMQEVMGEDAAMSSGAYGLPTYNWNLNSYTYSQVAALEPWWFGYSNYIWSNDYRGINCVNSVIANMSESNEAGVDELLGQAYGIRGYLYLRLVRLFAQNYTVGAKAPGVILIKDPTTATSERIGRSSLEDTYKFIISDLENAYDLISGTATNYLTKQSVALLLARAYLDMADFSNAKSWAEKAAGNVFDGSNLMSAAQWNSGFKDHNDEWLWYFDFNATTSNYYASIPSFYYLADGFNGVEYGGKADADKMYDEGYGINFLDGYSTVRWTKRFVDMFEQGDCRKMFPFYFYEVDGFFTNKFSSRSCIGDAEFPMCRIAEAYLIKAECEAQTGGDAATAKNVLNALQRARGASATDATLENIYKERRKELYGEGQRLNDIKRLHQALDRTPDQEHWADVKQLPADSPRFMLPIPEVETKYNPNVEQNEYWKK